MAQPRDLFLEQLAAHPDVVFLLELGLRPDDRLGEHAVIGEDEQAVRILVEAADGREARIPVRKDIGRAEQVAAADHADGRDFSRLGLARDDADWLVVNHRKSRLELRSAALIERQGLARQDLAAGVGEAFAIDAHAALGDQGVGLAARTDTALCQPLVDAHRLVAVIGLAQRHGLPCETTASQ